MPKWLTNFLGINWRTTILGIGAISAAVGRFALAFRSKNYDFTALAEDGQLIMTTAGLILAGIGAAFAKDQNVIGAGEKAKTVESDGSVTNRAGETVAPAPPPPAPPNN